MSEIRVRPARKAEIAEIESIGLAAYAQYRNAVPAPLFAAYLDDLRRLEQYWNEADVLVAERDGRLAGAVLFYGDAASEGLGLPGGWAGFCKLAVHPDLRGHGIGRALVDACVTRAQQHGAPAVGIHTASIMRAACHLYACMGFQRCSQFDLSAADLLGADSGGGDLRVIAFRLDLVGAAARME
jgi:predicted N-acetyltransferase YhbS